MSIPELTGVCLAQRTETHLYGSEDPGRLDVLWHHLKSLGWELNRRVQCPDGCTCGEGPYWLIVDRKVDETRMN